jgi:hypothetical protein
MTYRGLSSDAMLFNRRRITMRPDPAASTIHPAPVMMVGDLRIPAVFLAAAITRRADRDIDDADDEVRLMEEALQFRL